MCRSTVCPPLYAFRPENRSSLESCAYHLKARLEHGKPSRDQSLSCQSNRLIRLHRPGDNPNQCSQGYNCPPPTVTLDNFDTFGTRYVDVGSGGPSSFTFTVTTNATWVKLSQTEGSVSPSAPETRIFASVNDWSQLPAGTSLATLTFTTTSLNPFSRMPLSVPVVFNVTKHTLPSTFKGNHSWRIVLLS